PERQGDREEEVARRAGAGGIDPGERVVDEPVVRRHRGGLHDRECRASDGPHALLPGRPEPYPWAMQMTAAPERDIVSWDDLDRLVADLAEQLAGTQFDVMLCITRGGLVPAGMLAYRLRIRNILVAAVEYYDDAGQPGPRPTFLQFPADPLLRGQRVLIV